MPWSCLWESFVKRPAVSGPGQVAEPLLFHLDFCLSCVLLVLPLLHQALDLPCKVQWAVKHQYGLQSCWLHARASWEELTCT